MHRPAQRIPAPHSEGVARKLEAVAFKVFDLVVQRATVDLFESYGTAIAPSRVADVAPAVATRGELVSVIPLRGDLRGSLLLRTSRRTLDDTAPSDGRSSPVDWHRELVNQLAGRICNRFARWNVFVRAGTPASLGGETPAPSSAELRALAELPKRFYLFNTIGNDVVVTIAGSASEVLFRFLTSALVAVEGEVILFPEPSQTR
jgi:hypothetical protein